jgi:myo-inositol-1-phosphate synthase
MNFALFIFKALEKGDLMKKHLLLPITLIVICSCLTFFTIRNWNTVETYAYNYFGSNEFVELSKNPLKYKTKRLDCKNRFIKFMKNRGYDFIGQEGADLRFKDKTGNIQIIYFTQVDYYMVFSYIN